MTRLLNRKKNDILETIEKYVDLTRAGEVNRPYYKGCCPFHDDNDPSFIVYPGIQRFYCYGCFPEGGDVLTFLSLYHKISIEEARELGTIEAPLEDLAMKQMKVLPTIIDEQTVASRCYNLVQEYPLGTCLEVFQLVDGYIERQQYTLLDRLLKRYRV